MALQELELAKEPFRQLDIPCVVLLLAGGVELWI